MVHFNVAVIIHYRKGDQKHTKGETECFLIRHNKNVHFVLFCLIKKAFCLTFCVFDFFFRMPAVNSCFRFFPHLLIQGKSKLYHIMTQTDVINWFQIPSPQPPPKKKHQQQQTNTKQTQKPTKNQQTNLLEVRVGPCLLSKGMCCSEELLFLCCCVLKFGSISLVWAFLCVCNLDAVLMQSGLFMFLNSLQLEGCAFNNVRWLLMPLFASLLMSHKRSSPLAAHFQESCHFLFVLSFIYQICFPFFQRCFSAGAWLLL